MADDFGQGGSEMEYGGPTLNESYNDLLRRWSADTDGATCECCGCDVTGRNVHDLGHAWGCDDCVEEPCGALSDHDERMAERRQMGLVNF